MILATVFGLSLVTTVALDNRAPVLSDPGGNGELSVRQKMAALSPPTRRATQCIARAVSADPRYSEAIHPGELNDLIVDAMQRCERPLRLMIQTHDRLYGYGSGEAFMLGPYLTTLPAAVFRQMRARSKLP